MAILPGAARRRYPPLGGSSPTFWGTARGASHRPNGPGYRCICINRSIGIIARLRFAMTIIEPNRMRPTTKMPKASARKLLVWSRLGVRTKQARPSDNRLVAPLLSVLLWGTQGPSRLLVSLEPCRAAKASRRPENPEPNGLPPPSGGYVECCLRCNLPCGSSACQQYLAVATAQYEVARFHVVNPMWKTKTVRSAMTLVAIRAGA
jgi:hypothetical protein